MAYSTVMELIDFLFLSQLALEPNRGVRGNNILSLTLTNKPQDVIEVNTGMINLIGVSDHKLVEGVLGYNPLTDNSINIQETDPLSFRAINYHQVDMVLMNQELKDIDWFKLKTLCDEKDDCEGAFQNLLTLTVFQVSFKNCPRDKSCVIRLIDGIARLNPLNQDGESSTEK